MCAACCQYHTISHIFAQISSFFKHKQGQKLRKGNNSLDKDKDGKRQVHTLASCYLCTTTSDLATESTELLPVHK